MEINLDKNNCSIVNFGKENQLERVESKIWGREEWIVNKPRYCGKKLIVKKGYRCSLHFHKIKEESFYILSGKILLETDDGKNRSIRIMESGDIAHIEIGQLHRFTGIADSELIEFSTFHMEEDSYRCEPSCKVDEQELNELMKSSCIK